MNTQSKNYEIIITDIIKEEEYKKIMFVLKKELGVTFITSVGFNKGKEVLYLRRILTHSNKRYFLSHKMKYKDFIKIKAKQFIKTIKTKNDLVILKMVQRL